MTITDCLGTRQHGRFATTLDATLDAPAKRTGDTSVAPVKRIEVVEQVASTRMLSIADLLRAPRSGDTIDVHAATYDIAA